MATINLADTPQNRYLKQVFDHVRANFQDESFGYDDLPGDSRGAKSTILVLMKQLGLRESVALHTFALTDKGKIASIHLA